MKALAFKFGIRRDVVGNHVDLTVNSEVDRPIARVETTLDGYQLGDDRVINPSTHFERGFRQAGGAAPGMQHVLEVRVRDTAGTEENATKIWVDDL